MPQVGNAKDEIASEYQERGRDRVSRVLHKARRRSEEEEASQYAKKLGLPYIDLNIFPIDQENINFVPEGDANRYRLVVMKKMGREIKVATAEPENPDTLEFLKQLEEKEGLALELYVVSHTSLERGLENYKRVKLTDVLDLMRMNLSGKDLENFENELKSLVDLEKRIRELPVTEVLNVIIAGAMKLRASDIHFEPQKYGKVRLRYRIDGVLQTVAELPLNIYPTILSRIKMISGMMINVRDISQDGRFSIRLDEKNDMDVRVSILPGNFGESIVLRLLNMDTGELQVEKVGLEGLAYDRLVAESEKKQGMILNSGPTGSGKTTTLYAIINRINTPDKKVITIEDPIEYQIAGISQTQVEKERGYTFANGLRAIVRQDPDVVLVGEIRDEETAEIATHAALTGHLVLSTIHANSAAGTIPRLIDLGIKPSLITSSVNALIAQRLLRKLCPSCKEQYEPAEETVDGLKKMLSIISPKSKIEVPKQIKYLWRAKGCADCRGIGYKGRIGIFEILTLEDETKEMIEALASEDDIMKTALESGMITMEQDGVLKALEGETSLEELQRVTGKGDYLLKLYEKIMSQMLSRGVNVENDIIEKVKQLDSDYDKLRTLLEEASSKDVIRYVLAAGLLTRAGDIHIEPAEHFYNIRFRIDGVLQDIVKLPITEYLPLLNEIKLLSGFKTESREGVIDGRFAIRIDKLAKDIEDKEVDVRVSIILGGYGDIVVMRLLNQAAQATQLESLGINDYNLAKLREEISKPNGIILNTGPTGSGKTTTLYSLLGIINKPEVKIITVEDPIEYQMEGVIQTQVNRKEKYTFATAMRALLRQNPDVMMVGEIRDEETAKIAYQAALTGHLVLTTLHTNNAAGSVQRLVNMGLSLSDLASGTNCFMAQRLVRKLCPHCKKKREPTEQERKKIEETLQSISPKVTIDAGQLGTVNDPVGCKACNNTGFHGRIAVSEILQVDKDIEKFLVTNPTTSEVQAMAIENGMITMLQDGVIRVVWGETTLDEVLRVAGGE